MNDGKFTKNVQVTVRRMHNLLSTSDSLIIRLRSRASNALQLDIES